MSINKPVLAFDTALGECSVAIWNGRLLASEYESERNRQTSRLVPMIESVMQKASLSFADLGAVVTTSGPGSFTGIRIGLSVARGFSLASAVPCFAVSTLELLAWQAALKLYSMSSTEQGEARSVGCGEGSPNNIATLINAYRGEVYCQTFRFEAEKLTPLTPAISILQEDVPSTLPTESCLVVGDAAALASGQNHQIHADICSPDAAALAEYIALQSLNAAQYPPHPVYIRAPDAKIQTPLLAS